MSNYQLSAAIAFVLTLLSIGIGQIFKAYLSSSRQGTLIAGGLGAFVFMFTLTTLSNLKMSLNGVVEKSGLFDITISLFIAIISSGSIHRIAITICILFSIILLFFLNNISNNRYTTKHLATSSSSKHAVVSEKKRK